MKRMTQLNRFMLLLVAMLTMSLTSARGASTVNLGPWSKKPIAGASQLTVTDSLKDDAQKSWFVSLVGSDAAKNPSQNINNSYWQLGANGNMTTATFSTKNVAGTITSIAVDCAAYKGNGEVNVTVGGNAFGTQKQAIPAWSKVEDTDVYSGDVVTFSGSATGEIVVTMAPTTGGRAIYLKSITVTYEAGGDDPSLEVSPESITFDNVLVGTASVAGQEVAVTMANIEEVLVGFSTKSPFKADKESLTESGTVVVTPVDSILAIVGEHVDTLVITDADKLTKKVPVSIKVVEPTLVNSVAFTKDSVKVVVGKTLKLEYAIAPDDAIDKRVSFQSLNEDALTVAEDGTITGVAENESVAVVITAMDSLNKGDKLTDTCYVTVEPMPIVLVESVAFNHDSVSVVVGKTLKLEYAIAPDDAIDKRVSFQSLNEDALTVAEDGTITGVAENESVAVVITAMDSLNTGDKLTDTCYVTVQAPKPISKFAGIFTSNISTSLKDSVVIEGTKYGAVKAGTSKAAGSTTIDVPAYTATLHLHAAGWKGESVKIQLESGKDTLGTFDLVADEGISGTTSTFTLKNDPVENDYFALEIGNEEDMEITVSAISGKRFVLFGINAEAQEAGDSVLVSSIAFIEESVRVDVGESLKLKYKIAPGNATDKSVRFQSLNEDALTVAADGTITGVAANASVAVVITALDSLNKGDKLVDTCFVTVVAAVYNTCAEANAAKSGDKLNLNPVTAVYVNSANIYVKDASGSTLVYLFDSGVKAGDVISGIKGVAAPYSGLPELKPSNKVSDWTIVAGEAPEIPVATAAPTAAEVNQVLEWKGVKGMDGEFTDAKATNITGKLGAEDIIFRNNFKLAYTFDAAKTYDITGAVAIYVKDETTTIQVYFISAKEHEGSGIKVATENAKAAKKMMYNGQMVIVRDGKMYNALGKEL